jgi:transglutaminase-like putative cysteine protease
MRGVDSPEQKLFNNLVDSVCFPGEQIQSFALLIRLNQTVFRSLGYNIREEEGVQSPELSLTLGTGSCRDSANLFLMAARKLGFAARFVSGYIYSYSLIPQSQSTHAWAEVFLPGAGWKGFDQTTGDIVSTDHIAVAVARLPESVPPVSGSFLGLPGSSMMVNVQVSVLT